MSGIQSEMISQRKINSHSSFAEYTFRINYFAAKTGLEESPLGMAGFAAGGHYLTMNSRRVPGKVKRHEMREFADPLPIGQCPWAPEGRHYPSSIKGLREH